MYRILVLILLLSFESNAQMKKSELISLPQQKSDKRFDSFLLDENETLYYFRANREDRKTNCFIEKFNKELSQSESIDITQKLILESLEIKKVFALKERFYILSKGKIEDEHRYFIQYYNVKEGISSDRVEIFKSKNYVNIYHEFIVKVSSNSSFIYLEKKTVTKYNDRYRIFKSKGALLTKNLELLWDKDNFNKEHEYRNKSYTINATNLTLTNSGTVFYSTSNRAIDFNSKLLEFYFPTKFMKYPDQDLTIDPDIVLYSISPKGKENIYTINTESDNFLVATEIELDGALVYLKLGKEEIELMLLDLTTFSLDLQGSIESDIGTNAKRVNFTDSYHLNQNNSLLVFQELNKVERSKVNRFGLTVSNVYLFHLDADLALTESSLVATNYIPFLNTNTSKYNIEFFGDLSGDKLFYFDYISVGKKGTAKTIKMIDIKTGEIAEVFNMSVYQELKLKIMEVYKYENNILVKLNSKKNGEEFILIKQG